MTSLRNLLALFTLVVLAATGCVARQTNSGPQAAPAAVPLSTLADLTLQVGDQKGGTEALLRAAGQLDGVPYRVAFSTFTSGPPQVEAATAGSIDFAIMGNTPPIFGAASNAKIKVVSAYAGGGPGNRILVHADSPITTVAELRGKAVAVGKGSSAHANLLAQLDKVGLKPADLKLVFLQPADALSAFTQHQADAWAIWDPFTAQAEHQIPVRSIAEATGVTNGDWVGVASDQALADARRNTALGDLLVRFERAARWAKAHPQEWGQYYATAVGLEPEVAAVAANRSLRLPTELSDEIVKSEQRLADLFAASQQIQSSPKFSNWVDRRYNEALRPNLVD
ncbi:ABC transporter substrate-binding protein [Mycobacterium kiyosense]|uniref:Putative aliphatic sulfonates-binding protein n=1 Tax=Mycobacterium kiyosense TaxID=2871094 RepID=A0A9P3QCC3_9MYCO|nr:ABC transporter substrate-binding protein [Mycobacterium kiyosense]GLB98824.1 ABC transporter substrate-binding protein [Mycobacterium kiyosense]GLD33536.1 ABC transporter substrate-binding protein [Mycobacterium kiyosense]GLD39112.1 ABC transporter substrate-binding protein [Mycobacterium kiyosense]